MQKYQNGLSNSFRLNSTQNKETSTTVKSACLLLRDLFTSSHHNPHSPTTSSINTKRNTVSTPLSLTNRRPPHSKKNHSIHKTGVCLSIGLVLLQGWWNLNARSLTSLKKTFEKQKIHKGGFSYHHKIHQNAPFLKMPFSPISRCLPFSLIVL